jgi:hypothetical protein
MSLLGKILQPDRGHGPHHDVFEMSASAESLLFEQVPDKDIFLDANKEPHRKQRGIGIAISLRGSREQRGIRPTEFKDKTVLASGRLTGTYER